MSPGEGVAGWLWLALGRVGMRVPPSLPKPVRSPCQGELGGRVMGQGENSPAFLPGSSTLGLGDGMREKPIVGVC